MEPIAPYFQCLQGVILDLTKLLPGRFGKLELYIREMEVIYFGKKFLFSADQGERSVRMGCG